MNKALRKSEIKKRMWNCYFLSGFALAAGIAELLVPESTPAFVALSLYAFIVIGLITLLILVVRNCREIQKLGCGECGAARPFFYLNPRRKCESCGSLLWQN
jgi:hypothetical protein